MFPQSKAGFSNQRPLSNRDLKSEPLNEHGEATHSPIWLEFISRSRNSVATGGLFSTRSCIRRIPLFSMHRSKKLTKQVKSNLVRTNITGQAA